MNTLLCSCEGLCKSKTWSLNFIGTTVNLALKVTFELGFEDCQTKKEGNNLPGKAINICRAKDMKILCITALIAWVWVMGDDVRKMIPKSDGRWLWCTEAFNYILYHMLKRVLWKGTVSPDLVFKTTLLSRMNNNSFSLEPLMTDASNYWVLNYYTEVSVNELDLYVST